MKKTIFAAGASVVLSALPIVGVFAETQKETFTDAFTFSITPRCAMSRVLGANDAAHTDGNGSWTTNNTTNDVFALTAQAGHEYSMGTSDFNVVCTGTNGYEVNVAIANLDRDNDSTQESEDVIRVVLDTSSATGSYWTVSKGSTFYDGTTGHKNVANSATPTPNAGQNFTMTYGLSVADGQASGTYVGSVTYTLTDLTPVPGGTAPANNNG